MSDMGDYFRDLREASQEKWHRNRANACIKLAEAGIKYVVKNGGAHFIVNKTIDFWPGTGLWIVRGTNIRKRGIKSLVKYILNRRGNGQ